MQTHKEIFTEIYDTNVWGGSGGGSMPSVNQEYIKLLEGFVRTNQVKTVIDFGCGDWQFSQFIDWGETHYIGIDCVQSVIDENFRKFSAKNIDFFCSDELNMFGDLLLLKDVLQHWTNDDIQKFLDAHKNKFKYIIITNNSGQVSDWEDSLRPHIETRPLSANFYPLKKYNAEIMLTTNINEPKETSLITNKNI